MNPDITKLDNQLCHRLYVASNVFTRAYRPLLQSLDITYPQYIVMMAMWEDKNLSVSDLVAKTRIDPGSMSLILKKLASKGFLRVTPSETDKRVKYVELTEKGEQSQTQAMDIANSMFCNLGNVDPADLEQLKELLDKLTNNLNQLTCSPK